jgi:hypothetical protein
LRGKHGTGIIKIDDKGACDWRKLEGNPFELFNSEGTAKWYDNIQKDFRFYVGHNRHATAGSRETKNAHPFTQEHITMVHNGTLTNTPDMKEFDVDSDAMCASIAKIGVQETINKTYGAYCIVYWDDKEKTLNLLRNHERPMFVGIDPVLERVAFASELGMLWWCLGRNQIKMEVKELEENMLYTFNLKSCVPKKTPMKKVFSYGNYNFPGSVEYESFPGGDGKFYEENEYLKLGCVWQYLKKGSKEHARALAQLAAEQKAEKEKKRLAMEEAKGKSLPAIVEKSKKTKQTQLKLMGKKENSKSGVLRAIDNLFGYHVGDRINFVIRDYQEIPGDKYILEGFMKEFKGLDIFMYISSKGPTLDAILETFKVRGTIRHMKFNLENTRNDKSHHQMWVSDPEVVYEALQEEEASIVIDGKSGLPIDQFEDPFEGSDAAFL